jgi:hypothetical protein
MRAAFRVTIGTTCSSERPHAMSPVEVTRPFPTRSIALWAGVVSRAVRGVSATEFAGTA